MKNRYRACFADEKRRNDRTRGRSRVQVRKWEIWDRRNGGIRWIAAASEISYLFSIARSILSFECCNFCRLGWPNRVHSCVVRYAADDIIIVSSPFRCYLVATRSQVSEAPWWPTRATELARDRGEDYGRHLLHRASSWSWLPYPNEFLVAEEYSVREAKFVHFPLCFSPRSATSRR